MIPMLKTVRQIGFFGLFGLIATAVHAAVFSGLAALGLDREWANVGGFLCALPISYFGNAKITFSRRPDFSLLVRFGIIAITGFFLNHANVLLVADWGYSWSWSLPGMLIVVPTLSFLLNKVWVYRA